jgi:hypothetical protein
MVADETPPDGVNAVVLWQADHADIELGNALFCLGYTEPKPIVSDRARARTPPLDDVLSGEAQSFFPGDQRVGSSPDQHILSTPSIREPQ